jgi:uncharacterized membrane-anchored protein
MKRPWAILALVLPLLVFLLAIGRAEFHLLKGETFTFAITGYDPRDLLRGHYLQFRVAYDWEEDTQACSTEDGQECCYCLMHSDGPTPKVSHALCVEAESTCDGYLRETEVTDLNRYYIPEEQAQAAEKLLRDGWAEGTAHIQVSITPDGEAQISDLQIGGESLDDLLRQGLE